MGDEVVVVLDAETTGTDVERDEIIELTVQLGLDGSGGSKTWRLNPNVPISPSASAVHGITREELQGCPRFAEVAEEIRSAVVVADVIVGYNVAFDLQILQSQYQRTGLERLSIDRVVVLDAYRLWLRCEPRTLQDAHKRFVGSHFEGAHGAAADVAATGRVLMGMITAFGLTGRSLIDVASVADPERARWIGPSQHVQWSTDGHVVLGFGKYSGHRVVDLARCGNYLQWILGKAFPPHVHEICREALRTGGVESQNFLLWVVERFGSAPKGE